MSLFHRYSIAMHSQDRGVTVEEYSFAAELILPIKTSLVNSDHDDEEAEFLLAQLKSSSDKKVRVPSHIAHHLYDYLQGHQL